MATIVTSGTPGDGVRNRDPKTTSVWLPYVRVADAKQAADAARAAGGRVIYEPAPLGRTVVGIIADPTGAPVGIVALAATETQP